MVWKLRPEMKQRIPVRMRKRAAESSDALILFIDYFIRKSRRRKSVRTRAVPAWLQGFFWRKRCQKRWRLRYRTIRR
jgi:hypothetical protein